MSGWSKHTGLAVPLQLDGVDTDQIIPARFMSQPRSEGYGGFLLHDMRRTDDGDLRQDFALNAEQAQQASVLIAGRNFGSGSSREAAVYALVDAGFQAVIAPSFGDIFAANAVNNGLAPIQVSRDMLCGLWAVTKAGPQEVTIDLQSGRLTLGDLCIAFELDEVWRQKLIEGWDDIDLTQAWADQISAFRKGDRTARPWARPQLQTE